jgi:hypothetical protein
MKDELSDETPISQSKTDNFLGYVILGVLGLLIWGGYWLWGKADAHGYFYHNKLAAVSSENWAIGEYKDCFSLNIKMNQPVLSCDTLLGGNKEKVFMVQFWGRTYIQGMPENTALEWKCTKTGDSDPSIKCERR